MATRLYKTENFVTDALTDIIHLNAHVSVSNNVSHFEKSFLTAGYQVTAGKTLWVVKWILAGTITSNPIVTKMGYADNDVGRDTTTARTAPVMAFGIDDTADNGFTLGGPNNERQTPDFMLFPLAIASKFPFVRMKSTTGFPYYLHIWCVEI